MIKKTVKYTDYNGVDREEDLYFNLSKTELGEMDAEREGGYAAYIMGIRNSDNTVQIFNAFKDIITKAYGEKSEDGRYFRKSEERVRDFLDSLAFEALVFGMLDTPEDMGEFFIGMLPKDLQEEGRKNLLKDQARQKLSGEQKA